MREIFFGQDGRIRSGWRALTFLLSFMLVASLMIFLTLIVLAQVGSFGETKTSYLTLTIPFAVSAVIAIVLGWAYGRLFESLPFESLGLEVSRNGAKHFLIGMVVGSIAIGSAMLIAVIGGGLSLSVNHESSGPAIATTLLTTLIIFLVAALSEETLFRGYLLQTFVRSELSWFGIALTSLLFASAHSSNPGTTGLAFANTVVAGVWFAIAYIKTRDLWFPLGVHFAWNWLQGPVFGVNVSGISQFSPDPVLRSVDTGPAVLTGGGYGIEGGFACTIALGISIGVIYFLPNDLLPKRSGS
jgi:membrane protease YdiL (CAAX protease family)